MGAGAPGNGEIETVDGQVEEWVRGVVGPVEVSLQAPGHETTPGVGLYLLDLLPSAPPNGSGRPPLQVLLRYLVTSAAESPKEAHRILGNLVFAAMEHNEFDVELAPLGSQTWAALGVAPRPSFLLRVPARRERPQPSAPLVRSVVVQTGQVRVLEGQVVGPGGRCLPQAQIAAAALRLATRTDDDGRFRFANLPDSVTHVQLSVRAGRRAVELKVELPAPDLVIRME